MKARRNADKINVILLDIALKIKLWRQTPNLSYMLNFKQSFFYSFYCNTFY